MSKLESKLSPNGLSTGNVYSSVEKFGTALFEDLAGVGGCAFYSVTDAALLSTAASLSFSRDAFRSVDGSDDIIGLSMDAWSSAKDCADLYADYCAYSSYCSSFLICVRRSFSFVFRPLISC